MTKSIMTIGGYGFTKERFFAKLIDNNVNIFIDIRQRRGVRGSEYSFLNSQQLQMSLTDLGIKYLYFKELSPNPEIRMIQKNADKHLTGKNRIKLCDEFICKYNDDILTNFDLEKVKVLLEENSSQMVFFCVEQESCACHRSIVVKKLSNELNLEIINL